MKEFELKLDVTTYKCTSTAQSREAQNWRISAKFHDLNITMEISEASKVSMDKVLVFISSFDETLKSIQQEKNSELTFINQLT